MSDLKRVKLERAKEFDKMIAINDESDDFDREEHCSLHEMGSQPRFSTVTGQDKPQPVTDRWKSMAGFGCMAVSAISFSLMTCGLKYLYANVMEISSFEVIYWKSLSMIVYEYFFIKGMGYDHMAVPKDLRVTVYLRALAGFGGLAGLYTSIKFTTLSKASVLFWTNPIFTAVYARIFLKE